MEDYRFLELVKRKNGFEFYQAFRDEVDWVIGGKGDTYWFTIMQDEAWVKDRKPRLVEDSNPHYHYVYGIGDKALDISEAYGVSIAYSDIKDPAAGFHLRYLYTGEDVEKPN